MERIFILAISLLAIQAVTKAQNLLLNGDFELINDSKGDARYFLKHYYAQNWFAPTDGSVDIFRSKQTSNGKHVKNIEPGMDCCIQTASGSYCAGLHTIIHDGYMEHLTGTLSKPLEAGAVYKISFAMRYYGDEGYFSKGFGYKCSADSFVFKSNVLFERKISPWYHNLFKYHKVYADFEFDRYLTDSTWVYHDTYYTAMGGEKFITFGNFTFKDLSYEDKIMRQLQHINSTWRTQDRMNKFILAEKSLFIKKVDIGPTNRHNEIGGNYYLLDDVSVEKVTDPAISLREATCDGCLDADPRTLRIPDQREVIVDKGFVGDLTFEISARLKSMEKLVVTMEGKPYVTVVNHMNNPAVSVLNYQFTYAAKKLRNRSIKFQVSGTNVAEIQDLARRYRKTDYKKGDFSGLIFTD